MRPRIAPLLLALMLASVTLLVGAAPSEAARLRPAPVSSVGSPMAGEKFALSGSVGRSVRRVVALQYYSSRGWRTLQRKVVPASGRYRFWVVQGSTTVNWRVRAPKVRRHATRLSRTVRLTRAAQSAAVSVADSTRIGRTVPVSTRFRPARPGRAVALQHWSGGSWVTVATGVESSAGTAAFTYAPSGPGRQSLRAVARGFNGAVAAYSANDVLATLPEKDVLVSAHRGYSSVYPENTLPAFQAAIEVGADWLEMDVRRTKDDATPDDNWVLMHDTTLLRTTNVESVFPERTYPRPENFTSDELNLLDAGSWRGSRFAGTKIPTWIEVLDAIKARGTSARIAIELKSAGDLETDKANIVDFFDLVQQRYPEWIDPTGENDKVVLTTFSPAVAEYLHDMRGLGANNVFAGEKPLGAEVGVIFAPESTPTDFTEYSWARQIGLSESLITNRSRADAVHAIRADLVGWTADSTDDILRLAVNGVDVVTSNDPAKARALLRP